MLKRILFLTLFVSLLGVTLFLVAIAPFHIYTLTLTEGVSTRFLQMKPSSSSLYDGHALIYSSNPQLETDDALYVPIHFSYFELPLAFNHPLFSMIPNIKIESSGPRLGASFFDGKNNELFGLTVEKNIKLEATSGEQKIFLLPIFKNYISRKSNEEFWRDLFLKKLSLPSNTGEGFYESLKVLRQVSYSELVYNLYILYNRSHLLPPETKKIYFDESTQHGLVELVSEDPLFKLERLYLIDKGIIYSLTIKTKRGQVAAEDFRNKIIKESSYKNSTPDSAIAIYAQYKNIPYEHRVDKQGMSYLYAAWSHDLLNKEFVRVIILFLEKGQSNLKYLKPFYEYAYKRFGTNLSSDNELLMEDADQKLKRKMKDELESEVKKEEHISGPKFDEVTTDSNEKIKMNLQKAKENKTNSDESARMLLQE